jgi:hypothetical protein
MVWAEGEIVSDGRVPKHDNTKNKNEEEFEHRSVEAVDGVGVPPLQRMFAMTCTRIHITKRWEGSRGAYVPPPVQRDRGDPGQDKVCSQPLT